MTKTKGLDVQLVLDCSSGELYPCFEGNFGQFAVFLPHFHMLREDFPQKIVVWFHCKCEFGLMVEEYVRKSIRRI